MIFLPLSFKERSNMQFNQKHQIIVENLMKIMRRSKLTEVEGVEMLAFSEAFYFLNDLNYHIENEILRQQYEAQQQEFIRQQEMQMMSAAAQAPSLSPFLEDSEENPLPLEPKNKKGKVK